MFNKYFVQTKNFATAGYRLYEYIKQHKLHHSLGCTLEVRFIVATAYNSIALRFSDL